MNAATSIPFFRRRSIALGTLLATALTLHGCGPMVVAGAATGAIVANDRRTAGTIVDDQTIELKIENKIASDKSVAPQVHVNATSFNKTVLLTGEAPSEELRDQVVALAGGTDGVKQVYNALELSNPSEYKTRNYDNWLTSKVKGQLIGRAEVDVAHVKVVAESSVVYLMGMVRHEEADAAAQIASEVEGVRRVVKVFEYLD
jgi:osmotically-inducible protein OsmY